MKNQIFLDINHLKDKDHDIAVLTVRHKIYLELTAGDILSILPNVKVIIDSNNIINDDTAKQLSEKGGKMIGVGKGHWESLGKE